MPENQEIKHVMFVCTGNTCRSPLAEVIAAGTIKGVEFTSAGVAAVSGLPASIGSLEAALTLGYDLETHRSRPVSKYLLEEADLVLTMTPGHQQALLDYFPEGKSKIFTLGEYVGTGESIPDPFGLGLEDYLKCGEVLSDLIKALAAKL